MKQDTTHVPYAISGPVQRPNNAFHPEGEQTTKQEAVQPAAISIDNEDHGGATLFEWSQFIFLPIILALIYAWKERGKIKAGADKAFRRITGK